MNSNIKILVADDHPLLLKGLSDELALKQYTALKVNNGAEALETILKNAPEIALLDIEMPHLNGFEVIQKCNEKELKTKFILLTSHKEKAFILKAKKLNISGYLLKDEPFSEIEKAIKTVLNDETYFSKTFDTIFKNEVSPDLEKINFLSPSERKIVKLIAKKNSTKEIGDFLCISPRTVEKHRANIIFKLDLPQKTDALTLWVEENKALILTSI